MHDTKGHPGAILMSIDVYQGGFWEGGMRWEDR